jgi:hypothetical protein
MTEGGKAPFRFPSAQKIGKPARHLEYSGRVKAISFAKLLAPVLVEVGKQAIFLAAGNTVLPFKLCPN